MSDKDASAASAKRWATALRGHWHAARPSDATAARQVTADERVAAEKAQKQLAHDGRVNRWEQATHRKWNRKNGADA